MKFTDYPAEAGELKLKPRAPIHAFDRTKQGPRDQAKGGFSMRALERLLLDCDEQPEWRAVADQCCSYYDGDQFSPEQLHDYRKAGLEPRVINLVQRTLNAVLGQEAKSRRDPRMEPDDSAGADVADAMGQRLKEAQRESKADNAISNGYAGQTKAGIGWVEVSRASDPRQYQYRVADVHRSEIWWDWRAKSIDLSDARWLVRQSWRDLDEVIAQMPQFDELLRSVGQGNADWMLLDHGGEQYSTHTSFIENDQGFSRHRAEWLDTQRDRIRMYEVWYRVPADMVCMRVGQKWVPVDKANPAHQAAIRAGAVKLERRVTMQVRKAMFAGPHRLTDEGTPFTRFPYVPFFAFRRDDTRTPYGLISGMVPAQDEYNDRRMRIQWMLKAQQLHIDSDALDTRFNTIDDIADNMMRPDMVAVMNPNRTNKSGAMAFRNDFQLQREQFEQMQDAKQLIQDIPGIYGAQLGNAPSGVTSGLAINSLVEQGIVAMGELNDNYSSARQLVFELLTDLIAEDMADPNMEVAIGTGASRRVIVLNTVDEQGAAKNVVKDAQFNTGLAEVPSSPAYMLQQSKLMGEMIRSLAGTPQAGMLIPIWVEQTTSFGPGRQQIADDMRRMSGIPAAADRQGAEQWQKQQQDQQAQKAAMEQQAAQLEQQAAGAKAALDMAKTALTKAQALQTLIEADTLANDPNEASLIDQALAEAFSGGQPSAPPPGQQAPGQPMPPPDQQGMPPGAMQQMAQQQGPAAAM